MRAWLQNGSVGAIGVGLISLHAVGFARPSEVPATQVSPWRSLVQPNARWVLQSTSGTGRLRIEVYDVRTVGAAAVARLRWLRAEPGKPEEEAGGGGPPWHSIQHVAITTRGLFILSPQTSLRELDRILARKPDYPSILTTRERNQKDSVFFTKAKSATEGCVGYYSRTECATESCYATLCVDAERGITFASGAYSPDGGDYAGLR